MSYGAEGGAAAAMAAIAEAIKASRAIVRLDPENFRKIISKTNKPLIVTATGGLFKRNYQYLTAYKGLVSFTKSPTELLLAGDAEIIAAREIYIPG
jgi:hypothetical protein